MHLRVRETFALFLETFCCSESLCQFFLRSDNFHGFVGLQSCRFRAISAFWLCSRPLKDQDPHKSGNECGRGFVTSKEEFIFTIPILLL